MALDKLIAVWLPITLGIVMIGAGAVNFVAPQAVRDSFARWGYPAGFHRVTGGLEVISGLLLLIPATSSAGAIGSAAILLAAAMTLIRHRDWQHLPGAIALMAVSAAVMIRV
jgi:membrane protein HdeD